MYSVTINSDCSDTIIISCMHVAYFSIHNNYQHTYPQGLSTAGPGECEKLIKCGSDAMILADLDNQILYPQVNASITTLGHIR